MIVTVTPNPCIDRTPRVDRLIPGELNRAFSVRVEAAGKGVNVSFALATEGVDTVAIVPLSSRSAAEYLGLLADTVKVTIVPIAGDVRVNTSIISADGTITKVNEPGPRLGPADAEAILEAASTATQRGWIVGCGSLPPGAPRDLYARLARLATDERRVAIDSSGDALAAAVAAGVALIKPNRDELAELSGRALERIGDVVTAARGVLGRSGAALVSLGRDGAVYVDGDRVAHAEAPIRDAVNSVGAGDALLAGFLAAGARPESLATAVAWAAAAVRSPGTRMRSVTEADRAGVVVHSSVDLTRMLTT